MRYCKANLGTAFWLDEELFCTNEALEGSDYCHKHQPKEEEE